MVLVLRVKLEPPQLLRAAVALEAELARHEARRRTREEADSEEADSVS